MAYYELQHSGAAFRKRRLSFSTSLTFPLHLHSSFEFLYVEEGEIVLTVEGARYVLRAGDHALIPPDAVHAYLTEHYSRVGLVIFHPDFLPELYEESSGGILRDPVIRSDERFLTSLAAVENDHLLFRSVLYRVAAEYVKNAVVSPHFERNGGFAETLSEYLEKHSAEPIDEETVARAMGYHPRYLSLLIRKSFGVSFRRLLNEYRVKTACALLRRGEGSVTEVSFASGFNSQTSFNRSFREVMGVTPMTYRKGLRKRVGGHSD